jgi:hypothetical protein
VLGVNLRGEIGVEEAADRHDPVASCQLRDVLCRRSRRSG